MRRTLALATAFAATASASASASASTLERIDLPSHGNVDASKIHFNGANHPGRLVANVLLPAGYDPARRYPVLYLLHGSGENYASWVTKTHADVVAKDLDAIVVMPDAASGFYVNHYNGGRRGDPGWERYFLDEVIPEVEARYPIRPERRWHAVAGFSMGGYGALYLAAQRPDYFGAAGSFSGFIATRRPELTALFGPGTGQSYEELFGPVDGPYAIAHDPVSLVGNLHDTRLFVISGNGVPDPSKPPSSSVQSTVTDSAGEAELKLEGDTFAAAAQQAGDDVTHTVLLGVHNHPYWTEHLRRFLAWDPFAEVDEHPASWHYTTAADRGRAFELSYRFGAPPQAVETLSREPGGTYDGDGAGTVELCSADGRGLVAALPFAGATLARDVRVDVPRRSIATVLRRGGLAVAITAGAVPVQVAPAATLLRGRRRMRLGAEAVTLAAGASATIRVPLTAAARHLLAARAGGAARVRVVARYGTCPTGRWTTVAATLTRG